MGGGLTHELSPERAAAAAAPTTATETIPPLPLTAYEHAAGHAAVSPTPRADGNDLVPVPPPQATSSGNPRQHLTLAVSTPPHTPEAADVEAMTVSHNSLPEMDINARAEDTQACSAKKLPEPVPPMATSADGSDREEEENDEAALVVLSSPSPSVSPPTSDHGELASAHDEAADLLTDNGAASARDPVNTTAEHTHTASDDTAAAAAAHREVLSGTRYRPLARSVSPASGLEKYSQLPLQAVQSALKTNHRVLRICLTGGPCAGKSTMLAQFQSKLPQRIGFDVYCVPEAATMLVTGGMQWDGDLIVEQQTALLRTQLALEDQFYALAVATGRPSIVFSDRGTMDGRAFCSDAQFAQILRRLDCTLEALRDRYTAVIHMVTAAIGAEAFYNLDNPARYEDLDGARASDLKLREMYVGHPFFRLLDNATSFDDKIERGLRLAAQIAGADVPDAQPAVTCHYLLRRACALPLPVPCASYTTTTTILSNSRMDEIRLVYQRQMPDGSCMHFFRALHKPSLTMTDAVPPPPAGPQTGGYVRRSQSTNTTASGSAPSVTSTLHHRKSIGSWTTHGAATTAVRTQTCIDTCQRISSKEYLSLLNHRDPMREDVVAEATQFFHDNVALELITILAPNWAAGKQTMSIECDEDTMSKFRFPTFVEVDREVPVDTSTTAFLISHRETGPLYTSLAFAPVFSRTVAAIGAHADVHNFTASTCDSSTIQQAASQLNTPLRPLQSLRQNSINSVNGGGAAAAGSRKSSFSAAARKTSTQSQSASDLLQAASPSADALPARDTSVNQISPPVDVPGKENLVGARSGKTHAHTPLAPIPLFPIPQSAAVMESEANVQEVKDDTAEVTADTSVTPESSREEEEMPSRIDGGEEPQRRYTPAALVGSSKTEQATFTGTTPLVRTLLPPIGARSPASQATPLVS